MTTRTQLAMDFSAPEPRDGAAELLVAAGYVPNIAILDLNGSLRCADRAGMPAPWNLPSRLFEFPIQVSHPDGRGRRTLHIAHPLLDAHPFVLEASARLDLPIEWLDDGSHRVRNGTWWHAVDLVASGRWRDLIETSRFTTPADVAGAASFGLQHATKGTGGRSGLSVPDAKALLRSIGSLEPPPEEACLASFATPRASAGEAGRRQPINDAGPRDPARSAWARIVGIEQGWFAHEQSRFLTWTPAGIAMRTRFEERATRSAVAS